MPLKARTPLDYATCSAQPANVSMRILCYFLVAFVALFLIPPLFDKTDYSYVDAISGSMKYATTWRLGFTSRPRFATSPLELKFRAMALSWSPDWRMLHGRYGNALFGSRGGVACGSAPPIYPLLDRASQQLLLTSSADTQLRELFTVLSAGTEAEQKAAVDAACDRALP